MVNVLSKIIAVLITVILACVLYPIAAFFWILGIIGKLSDNIFSFTNSVIKKLWSDIKEEGAVNTQNISPEYNNLSQIQEHQTADTKQNDIKNVD